ncbi:MAG: hypothetical protein V7K89_05270 [Nostoc sp.]|uniref:hypothetical protein n=1 Tax=Nostoc sp. TaxID=1180 RepID=UPI002FF8F4F4
MSNKFVVRTLVLDLSAEALTKNQALLTWRTTKDFQLKKYPIAFKAEEQGREKVVVIR